MEQISAKDYLSQIALLAKDIIHEAAVRDTEDGAALMITAPSPYGEERVLTYCIELEPRGEDMLLFHTVIYCFTDVPEDRFGELAQVINELDLRLTVGSFILFEEGHTVMLSHGFLLGTEVGLDLAAQTLLRSIHLMENAAAIAGDYIDRLLKGECTAEDIRAELAAKEAGANE